MVSECLLVFSKMSLISFLSCLSHFAVLKYLFSLVPSLYHRVHVIRTNDLTSNLTKRISITHTQQVPLLIWITFSNRWQVVWQTILVIRIHLFLYPLFPYGDQNVLSTSCISWVSALCGVTLLIASYSLRWLLSMRMYSPSLRTFLHL